MPVHNMIMGLNKPKTLHQNTISLNHEHNMWLKKQKSENEIWVMISLFPWATWGMCSKCQRDLHTIVNAINCFKRSRH